MCRNRINLNAELCNMNRETENSFPPTAFPAGGKVKRIYLGAFVLLFALFNPCLVLAQTTIDFENMPYLVDLNDQYSQLGVTFENGAILTAYLSLNEVDFPPHSGSQVAGDTNGPLVVHFINAPAKSVSGWFTYSAQLTLSAYDNRGNLVNTVNSAQSSNYGTSEFISLTASPEIRTLIIEGNPSGQHYIMDDFQFELISTYTITASAGSNGSINPSGNIVVNYGSNQQFTATPATGYQVDTWFLDGSAVQTGGMTYTLSNITANHTVSVTFKTATYSITASAGSNGSINPSGNVVVNYGSNQQFTATPNAGYAVATWLRDGTVVQTGGTTYTLYSITANHTVSVTFIVTYTITVSADPNGSISSSGNLVVNSGSNYQFTATPNAGYTVNAWLLDGAVVKTGGTAYTLSNITANHTVSVTFKTATYSITASAGSNGSISPLGSWVVNYGSNQQFTATPNAGYAVNTWSLDGAVVQTGGTTYTLSNIRANHTISVTFIVAYTITASADPNGSISPSGNVAVASGSNQQFTATPNAGYTVNTWLLDGAVVQTGGTTYTLSNIRANHTVSVTFIVAYTITASADPNGSISPAGNVVVAYGGNQQFTATPNDCYEVDTWVLDGTVVQTGGTTYTLSNITANHTVSVTFRIAVVQTWVARYNGPTNSTDIAAAMALDNSGNIYVTGTTGMKSGYDYATIKYDPNGNQKWVALYNGLGYGGDWATDMAVDNSGNVYVTGYSPSNDYYGPTNTHNDYATIKYDTNGNQKWVARYNGPGNSIDIPSAIASDNSGNVYVTGYSIGSGTDNDYATIKYDLNGNQIWVTRYNGPGNGGDKSFAIALDIAGNVYVTGSSTSSDTNTCSTTIKYDPNGNQKWVARYNGVSFSGGRASIALDSSGNVYVLGIFLNIQGDYILSDDYATIKYDPNGNQIWVARYDSGGGSDYAEAIALDKSGNVYVTGNSAALSTGWDYATVKYDPNGNQKWVARYNGPANYNDNSTRVVVDGSGNVYVTGQSSGTAFDYATIKYDPNGNQIWVARYNGSGSSGADSPSAIALDNLGNIYVTGYSCSNGNCTGWDSLFSDYATIKYSEIQNNRPPVANAGPDQKVEQNSPDGAQVQLDGSASSDPEGDSLTYTWTWAGGSASGVNPVVTLPIGLTTVSLTVSDGKLTNTDTVDITVVAATCTITASAGSNGSINPSGNVVVNSGSNQQFTATPNTGYAVNTWSLDGAVIQTGGTSYTLNSVTAAHTVSVTFELLTYTVTASAGTNGSISPSGAITVNYATNQQFTATPATGYQVDTWLLDGSAVQTGGTSYTLRASNIMDNLPNGSSKFLCSQ